MNKSRCAHRYKNSCECAGKYNMAVIILRTAGWSSEQIKILTMGRLQMTWQVKLSFVDYFNFLWGTQNIKLLHDFIRCMVSLVPKEKSIVNPETGFLIVCAYSNLYKNPIYFWEFVDCLQLYPILNSGIQLTMTCIFFYLENYLHSKNKPFILCNSHTIS